MHLPFLYPALLALLTLSDPISAARKPSNGVLLSQVKTLTLRADTKTSHRRVSAIPQLKCVGGNGCPHYKVDVMRCKNAGSDYDDDNIQWTCSANLPGEFKLGSTDVICEGYNSPQDPYVLKGSCGVEYRLILTESGEEKYGGGIGKAMDGFRKGLDIGTILFWGIFLAVAARILYSIWVAYQGQGAVRVGRPPRRNGGFWGGGWGGGGGGGGGGNGGYDPPPPYPGKQNSPGTGQQGWRPGFWTGALGGAAAGYMAGSGRRQEPTPPRGGRWFGDNNQNTWGSGPSTRPNTRSDSGPSARYESTGFGSTTRR